MPTFYKKIRFVKSKLPIFVLIISALTLLFGCFRSKDCLNTSYNLVSLFEKSFREKLKSPRKIINYDKVTDQHNKEVKMDKRRGIRIENSDENNQIVFHLSKEIKSADLFSINFSIKVNSHLMLTIERKNKTGETKGIASVNLIPSDTYAQYSLKVNGSRELQTGDITALKFNLKKLSTEITNHTLVKNVQFFSNSFNEKDRIKTVDIIKDNRGIRNLFFKSIILSKKQNVSFYLNPSQSSELTFYGKCISGKKSKILIKKRGLLKSSTISSLNLEENWRYHKIPLGSFDGEKIELSLETSDDNSLSAISSLYFQYDNSHTDKKVVFLLFDALRGDAIGAYGYKKPTTPNIDRFATEQIYFPKCFSPSPTTARAVMGYISSCWGPFNLGNGQYISDNALLFPEVINQEGYLNFGITGNTNASSAHNLAQGYDIFIDASQGAHTTVATAKEIQEEVTDFIHKNKNKKIFLYAHFIQPHLPYSPTEENHRHFDFGYEGNINALVDDKNSFLNHPWENLSQEDKNQVRTLYDASIRDCDTSFKNIIDNLKTDDLLDNSMIIVLSDHGEYFGDHLGYKAYNQTFRCKGTVHPPFLFNTSIHVPLILSVPGIKNIKYEENMSSVDLFPTILDFLNIDSTIPMQGINLMPYLKGRNHKKDRYIFSTHQDDDRLSTSVIHKEHKLIKYYLIKSGVYLPYETEFFNLKHNPHENTSFREEKMKKHLEDVLKNFLDYQLHYVEKITYFRLISE